MGTQEELERGMTLVFLQCGHKPSTRELHGLLALSWQFREIWCPLLVFENQAGKALIYIKIKIKKKT